jgi:hypothetical protein
MLLQFQREEAVSGNNIGIANEQHPKIEQHVMTLCCGLKVQKRVGTGIQKSENGPNAARAEIKKVERGYWTKEGEKRGDSRPRNKG